MLGFLSALKKADYGFFQNDFGNKSEIIKKYKYGHPPPCLLFNSTRKPLENIT